jgi:hypothetical protein
MHGGAIAAKNVGTDKTGYFKIFFPLEEISDFLLISLVWFLRKGSI